MTRTNTEFLTVQSTFGSVKGFVTDELPTVAQFLGIPFAEPPLGPFRWLPPKPKTQVENFDATAFGPSCPQITKGPPSLYSSDVREFMIADETSEDCLSICIWAPKSAAQTPSANLPVIVWLTGGSLLAGGNSIPYQNPSLWVESSQRHICVSINYRVGILGFPNAAGLLPLEQNLGFLDQRLGLEWVQKHIQSFGGDPTRIIHWGQSAGGRSVDCNTYSYPSNPIISGVIMHSGTVLPPYRLEHTTHAQFSVVAKALGFSGGSPAEELAFMREQSADAMIDYILKHYVEKLEPVTLRFQPIVDDITLFGDYEERTKNGQFSKVPVILGTTADEGNAMAPYSAKGVDQSISEAITRNYFLGPTNQVTRWRSEYVPTFRFLYKDPAPPLTSSFPNISPRPWQRAYHCSDLPLIFGTHSSFRGPSTPMEWKVSRAWQEFYVAFAEDGPEGLVAKGWKEAKDGEGVIFGIGEKGWESASLEVIEDNGSS